MTPPSHRSVTAAWWLKGGWKSTAHNLRKHQDSITKGPILEYLEQHLADDAGNAAGDKQSRPNPSYYSKGATGPSERFYRRRACWESPRWWARLRIISFACRTCQLSTCHNVSEAAVTPFLVVSYIWFLQPAPKVTAMMFRALTQPLKL